MIAPRDLVVLALHRRADSGAVSRGVDVERQGKVVRISIAADGRTLKGQVRGSGGKTYQQVVTIRHGTGPQGLDLSGHCSCPVGEDCKHVVALCLSAADKIAARAEPPQPTAPRPAVMDHRISHWLRRVAAAEMADASMMEEYAPTVRDRLLYVVSQSGTGSLKIEPWKGRLNKDGSIGGRPTRYDPANADRGNRAQFIRLSDETICRELARMRYAYNSNGIEAALLKQAIETGRARLGEATGLALESGDPRKGQFLWEETEAGAQQLVARDEAGQRLHTLALTPPWYVDPQTGEAGPFETGLSPAMAAVMAMAPSIPAEAAGEVAEAFASRRGTALPAPKSRDVRRERDVSPMPVLTLWASDVRGNIRATSRQGYGWGPSIDLILPVLDLAFTYGDAEPVVPLTRSDRSPPPIRLTDDDGVLLIERDPDQEAHLLEQLASQVMAHGLIAAPGARHSAELVNAPDHAFLFDAVQEERGPWHFNIASQLAVDEAALGIIGEVVPSLRAKGWQVEIDESWDWQLYDGPLDWSAEAERSGIDWLAFSLTVTVDGETLDMLPVILSVIDILPVDGTGALQEDFDLDAFLDDLVLYPQLESGTRIKLDAVRLAPIVRAFLEVNGLTGFHTGEAPQLRALADALEGCGIPWTGDPAILTLADKLNALTNAPEAVPPPSLKADLRPYQKTGFGWLKALSETGFGGALADDMGLGKTVQALALLAQRHLEDGGCDRPSIVIAPTSLVGVWQREAERFTPGLKVLVLHGPDRKAHFDEIADHHLIVTTYPLLHRDHEMLFAQPYDLAILDEAQAVKNPASSVAKRIRDVDARQRLALTGTPVENNLSELWAIFDWLVPGLLGDRRRFNTELRHPIEREGSGSAQKLLASRLRPFLLRRTKEEVAADLPPKTIIDERVPLEAKQSALYETLRIAMDARVKAAIKAKGVEKSRITILDALLKLRQACCDPALVKLDAARKVTESAKRDRLMALLESLVAEGRKVLIFSQFVEMLKLIETDVQARGWDYAMLTGRTRKRADQIALFQEGNVPLFLISLKAGGTGLTLTEADTVILYDPWWNPAVERQAMDRAHRIGQTKPVFVHRLIAEGTVEAAIQQMQAKKQALADALFEEGSGGRLDMGEDDIAALFSPIGSVPAK